MITTTISTTTMIVIVIIIVIMISNSIAIILIILFVFGPDIGDNTDECVGLVGKLCTVIADEGISPCPLLHMAGLISPADISR